jgi:hypothetical protein
MSPPVAELANGGAPMPFFKRPLVPFPGRWDTFCHLPELTGLVSQPTSPARNRPAGPDLADFRASLHL